MTILTVYKNTELTVGEMLEALKALDFVEIPSDQQEYKLQHKTVELFLFMPRQPLDSLIKKYFTAKFSYQLALFEITKDHDDLVKAILKERAKKKRALKKQQALAAA